MGRTDVEHPTFTLKKHPVLDVLKTLLIRKVYICLNTLPFEKRKI